MPIWLLPRIEGHLLFPIAWRGRGPGLDKYFLDLNISLTGFGRDLFFAVPCGYDRHTNGDSQGLLGRELGQIP
jgi:hypothetical protein